MRPFLTALSAVLLLVCLQPTTASAAPAPALCTPDGTRGGVPADFALDACVDATSITVRNDLDGPVLVRRDGDVGVPVRVHERGSAAATVLRLLSGTDELLMPGDVVRWPLAAGAGTLGVADLEPSTAAIVGALDSYLARPGDDQEDFRTFAVVVRETAAAIQARMACADGKNFLQGAACDVVAASTVSRAVVGQLPRRSASELLPIVLDPGRWADWVTARPTELSATSPSARTLTQAAVAAPVVAAPVVAAPVVVAPPVPAAPPDVAVPAPAVVPTPTPSPPQLPDLGTGGRVLGSWLEDALGRLGSARAGGSVGDGNANGNGNGHGRGHGHGNGRGGD